MTDERFEAEAKREATELVDGLRKFCTNNFGPLPYQVEDVVLKAARFGFQKGIERAIERVNTSWLCHNPGTSAHMWIGQILSELEELRALLEKGEERG